MAPRSLFLFLGGLLLSWVLDDVCIHWGGGKQVLIQPPAYDLEKYGHSPDPLFAVGQNDRDKGMLQSATKGSAVFCEWNAKQFPSHSQDRCALCVCVGGENLGSGAYVILGQKLEGRGAYG